VVVANPVSGGSGASGERDGISGAEMSVAFLRNVPVEVLEAEAPVVVRRFGLDPDSEGPGKFSGGFGVAYELEIRHPSAVVVMRGKDRQRFCAWGAAGGRAGTISGNVGTRRGADGSYAGPHDIGKRTVYRAELGELIRLWGGGGGGFGDPFERDPELVLADVAAGLVSTERARDVYGVVVRNGAIDSEATTALRRKAPAAGPQFDFGPARIEWERVHGEAAERIGEWLPTLPVAVRRYAQAEAYRRLHASSAGPYRGAVIDSTLAAIGAAFGQQSVALRHAAE
jgi:N-methylhydantoinase B